MKTDLIAAQHDFAASQKAKEVRTWRKYVQIAKKYEGLSKADRTLILKVASILRKGEDIQYRIKQGISLFQKLKSADMFPVDGRPPYLTDKFISTEDWRKNLKKDQFN